MGKGYYIVGALLLGVGGYLLYNKIRNGNSTFNFRDVFVEEKEEGSHLDPPIKTTINTPPIATPPFVSTT
jgi:hypothetical protein